MLIKLLGRSTPHSTSRLIVCSSESSGSGFKSSIGLKLSSNSASVIRSAKNTSVQKSDSVEEQNIRICQEQDIFLHRYEREARPRRRSIRLLLVRHATSASNLTPMVGSLDNSSLWLFFQLFCGRSNEVAVGFLPFLRVDKNYVLF